MDAAAEYEWLFREEFPAVMRSVFLICHDTHRAQDITQDAFVQLLKHWEKVSRYDRPGAWVRRVAIRLTMQSLRRERLRSLLERHVEPPVHRVPVDLDVLNAIRSLPKMQRAAVVLFYFDDMPLVEVADILGCSNATARVHLHRARGRLAELLGEEALDDVP
jgi:RNA polymerase sigma factor (sigma-70 family)